MPLELEYHSLAEAAEGAQRILDDNWQGTHTLPAQGLYPHAWSWDSAFIAIGRARTAPERGAEELRNYFRGQWANGMCPHIVFAKNNTDYTPGPEFWQSAFRSDDAPDDVETSGLIQPPIHACAALHVARHWDDETARDDFLREMYPKLRAWHDYLYRERDPIGEGLIYIRHPWESGRDNSPVWDQLLSRFDLKPIDVPQYQRADCTDWKSAGRPSDAEYDAYMFLAEQAKREGYRERSLQRVCPFLVQDLLSNTVLVQAELDLAEIARMIGEDVDGHQGRADKTAEAMRRKLWDDQLRTFLPYDVQQGRRLHTHELGGFTPLFARIPTDEQAGQIAEQIESKAYSGSCHYRSFAAAGYSRIEPGYQARNYWRGPLWININWLIYRGLIDYEQHEELSKRLLRSIYVLPVLGGFREHYNPENGEGQGAENFSWSAALFLEEYHSGSYERLGIDPHAEIPDFQTALGLGNQD
ncbi:MAG: glycoside hydrolase family protein [Puniceicoccaceae bacterium 5H]|nr:MAG: glycoside hydrolase family protein [Puniceicoccaceae bacterium 5H]